MTDNPENEEHKEEPDEQIASLSDSASEAKDEQQDNSSNVELHEIQKNISEIRNILEQKISYDKTKELAFERLYSELDAYKRNQSFEDSRPLFIDLILLYDRLDIFKEEAENPNLAVLNSIQEELNEILLRRHIIQVELDDNSFNPSLQRAVSRKTVNSIVLDGKVVSILRHGFTFDGTVIRPQEVVLGHYQESSKDFNVGENNDNG